MSKLPARNLPWPISWDGVVEIASSEGCRLTAYLCSAGVPTIGWGETVGVKLGMRWSQAEADERFCKELTEYADAVRAACKVQPNDNQLAAMVSLAYNIGLGGFKKSSVLRNHNKGDYAAAARSFALWNKARVNGVLTEVRGLTLRRARETAMYLKPFAYEGWFDVEPEMPQAVEPESKLQASPIAQSGAVSIATGALAAASQFSSEAKQVAENLSINPLMVVAVVAVVIGAVAIYQRYKQRAEGWA